LNFVCINSLVRQIRQTTPLQALNMAHLLTVLERRASGEFGHEVQAAHVVKALKAWEVQEGIHKLLCRHSWVTVLTSRVFRLAKRVARSLGSLLPSARVLTSRSTAASQVFDTCNGVGQDLLHPVKGKCVVLCNR